MILPLLLILSAAFSPVAQDDSSLTALLPDPGVFGAEISVNAEIFGAENLYEYINGAAEAFIGYDFQRLVHQIYLIGETEVTVDIYDMGSGENAFGIYSSERGSDQDYVDVGTEGYQTPDLLNFFKGRYYVKLSAYGRDPKLCSRLLYDFGKTIDQKISAGQGYPEIFALFPSEHLVPHSRSFVKRAPLGHQFLSPGYLSEYLLGGEDVTLLLSPSEDPNVAAEKLVRLRKYLSQQGDVRDMEKIGEDTSAATTKYEGAMLAGRFEHYVLVLVGPQTAATQILQKTLETLEKATAAVGRVY